MFGSEMEPLGQTWTEIDGEACGARADESGPIGGGEGYNCAVSAPADTVSTLDDLLEALAQAKSGDVVYVDGNAEIDCTERVYIESLVLEIPEGVTLASDRGADGSNGGMILSDTFDTNPLIHVTGPNVRVSGLRIKGPNPKRCLEHHNRSFREGRGHEYYYKFPTSNGITARQPGLEVDNCEAGGLEPRGGLSQRGRRTSRPPQFHPSQPVQRPWVRGEPRRGVLADRIQPVRLQPALARGNGQIGQWI